MDNRLACPKIKDAGLKFYGGGITMFEYRETPLAEWLDAYGYRVALKPFINHKGELYAQMVFSSVEEAKAWLDRAK